MLDIIIFVKRYQMPQDFYLIRRKISITSGIYYLLMSHVIWYSFCFLFRHNNELFRH
ncbi:hypothetical protein PITCH_A640015 [uncultured Desulfobacterium sp.]|uniref:Uncharacterized protein n=1 Tax=uncultured Desulfobacterium sp. TaxID=201089 RepID=A0A445N1A5_9BACT|nr:hypothetical protein PITCH_A640015 [uncultured Desulfobacterium sp.]